MSKPPPVDIRHLSTQIGLREPQFDSDGRTLVWLERRGAEATLVCRRRGEVADRDIDTARTIKARLFYGGGDFTVSRGRVIYVGDGDRLCLQSLAGGPGRDLTPAQGCLAAPTVSRDGRWVAYVHTDGTTDRLAIVDSEATLWPQSLVSGADFYMQPVWHPSGRQLAWIEWDVPNMAWDGCRLMLGTLRKTSGAAPMLVDRQQIAGGDAIAVFQPAFSADGRWLAYASDASGTSQLYLHDLTSGESRCLTPDAEGDVAAPAWVQGLRVLAFAADSRRLFFTRSRLASRLAFVGDVDSGRVDPVVALADYTNVAYLNSSPRGNELVVTAAAPHIPERIVTVHTVIRNSGIRNSGTKASGQVTVQARSSVESLLGQELSTPRPVQWLSIARDAVHGLLYPAVGVDGAAPLLVDVHGGPTSQDMLTFDAQSQFWATRGWAVLSVNYRGSSGYGRAYMRSLRGQWGVYDVEDAIGGARHLIDTGIADPDRLVIMGGSAGGYTVLRALGLHPGFFRAGICRYGISSLFGLARTTHKFEAHYINGLVGPLPEAADLYRARSPIYTADAIADPIALFQGDEDEVVTRDQSDDIVASLQARSVPHEYHVYQGEGHGWRRVQTKEAYIQAVEAFLLQHVLLA